jgi:hypothetical protein
MVGRVGLSLAVLAFLLMAGCQVSISTGNSNQDELDEPDQEEAAGTTNALTSGSDLQPVPAYQPAIWAPNLQASRLVKLTKTRLITSSHRLSATQSAADGKAVGPDGIGFSGIRADPAVGGADRTRSEPSIGFATGIEQASTYDRGGATRDPFALVSGPYLDYRPSKHLGFELWTGIRYQDRVGDTTAADRVYDYAGYFLTTSLFGLFDVGALQVRPELRLLFKERGNDDRHRGMPEYNSGTKTAHFGTEIGRRFPAPGETRITPFLRAGIRYEVGNVADDPALQSQHLTDGDRSSWRHAAALGLRSERLDGAAFEVTGSYQALSESDGAVWTVQGAFTIPLN